MLLPLLLPDDDGRELPTVPNELDPEVEGVEEDPKVEGVEEGDPVLLEEVE